LRWNECRDEKFRERWRAAGEIARLPNPCKPKNGILGKFLKEISEAGKPAMRGKVFLLRKGERGRPPHD
jgi:hypothetical protein